MCAFGVGTLAFGTIFYDVLRLFIVRLYWRRISPPEFIKIFGVSTSSNFVEVEAGRGEGVEGEGK